MSIRIESQPLRVAFVHRYMHYGGAQQLMINFALALRNHGHEVKMFATSHDRDQCFKETIDGTLPVKVYGNWWPRNIYRRLVAVCASIRMIICCLCILMFEEPFDVFVVDCVPQCIPVLKLFGKKVVYYGHYPDLLFCKNRKGFFMKAYRLFLDYYEEVCLYLADLLLTNSNYTKNKFETAFKHLPRYNTNINVLYPPLDNNKLLKISPDPKFLRAIHKPFFISFNRYERAKEHETAIKAFSIYKEANPNNEHALIIAGGFESQIKEIESVPYLKELIELAAKLGLQENKDLFFFKDVNDTHRVTLLKNAICLLYTPRFEHFGIIPTEAMCLGTPVIACNNAGPKESIVDGETGFLLQPNPEDWAEKMSILANEIEVRQRMSTQGPQHVKRMFGLESFGNRANDYILAMLNNNKMKNR